ncbi:MAG TPA: DUF6252 family protein [Sphingobacteriaceae bacterium]|nr:DUF6252 family protein [Sphingobacteriaceae bacterium]
MKTLQLLFLLPFAGMLLSASCKKEPLDKLPPATQEGRRTFGCLVNGKPFVHKYQLGNFGPPSLKSHYQHLNTPTAQGFFFHISASREIKDSDALEAIAINSNGRAIEEGKVYILQGAPLTPNTGEIYSEYTIFSGISINAYTTTGSFKGELHITKLDETNQIVSGTFWFDAVNDKGEKVEVREGRFDMFYTK